MQPVCWPLSQEIVIYFVTLGDVTYFSPSCRIDNGECLSTNWIDKFAVDKQLEKWSIIIEIQFELLQDYLLGWIGLVGFSQTYRRFVLDCLVTDSQQEQLSRLHYLSVKTIRELGNR